jgi:hypothetical protein
VLALLRRIHDRGHQIGLHFEPDMYGADWPTGLEREVELLRAALPEIDIARVSQHEPTRSKIKLAEQGLPAELVVSLTDITLYGFGSAHYAGAKYISDSGARWREGCMCEHIGKHQKLIVLTHPEWWFGNHIGEGY